MLPQKKVVKTYGKKKKKTLMSDNWLSPEPKNSKFSKSSSAFSDQSNGSTFIEERILRDETNQQSEKGLCNLLCSKWELSSPERTSPVLVPETPESEMKTSLLEMKICESTNKTVETVSSDKENKCTKRQRTIANKKENEKTLDEIFEDLEIASFIVKENKDSQKKATRLKKKNIKRKGRRVSIFHGNSTPVSLEDLSTEEILLINNPCKVKLSRLVLEEIPPDTSSPMIRHNAVTANVNETGTDRNKSVGIDEYIPSYLSPVFEQSRVQGQYWKERSSSYFQKSFTPCRGKRGMILSDKEKVLLHCGQSEVVPFSSLFTKTELENCQKIGEGVYGEVFQLTMNNQKVAVKVIPIEGELLVNDEPQKTFEEILPEIVISKELNCLRGSSTTDQTNHFIEVKSIHCCCGQFPVELLRKWDEFSDRKGSENDRPDSYCDQQLFIVFVFANGGHDLESFKFDNVIQMKGVLQQTIRALAVAESTLQFEHRDLHWGNVLVKKREGAGHKPTVLSEKNIEEDDCDLHVSIIDFTLSRLHKDGCTLFYDLSVDESLFQGEGDYQFDMYRLMRENNNNKWDSFNAYSNVLWTHYLTRKLLAEKKPKRSRKKVHMQVLQQLKSFERDVLKFKSAQEIVKMSQLFS